MRDCFVLCSGLLNLASSPSFLPLKRCAGYLDMNAVHRCYLNPGDVPS